MAVLPSPLDEPFVVLAALPAPSSSSGEEDSATLAHALLALKKIKNALIGNLSRKCELAQDRQRVALILDFVKLHSDEDEDDKGLECMLEALAVLSALCASREECLLVLVDLSLRDVLLDRITTLSTHSLPARDCRQLLHLTRTLRAFYTALHGCLDPLAAQDLTYSLVVESVQRRIGLHPASAPADPAVALTGRDAKGKGSCTKYSSPLEQCEAEIFSITEADIILRLILQTTEGLAPYWQARAAGESGVYPKEAEGVLLNLLEIVAVAVRSAEQRQAATTGALRDTFARAMLIVAECQALELSSDQLALGCYRAMSALLRQNMDYFVELMQHDALPEPSNSDMIGSGLPVRGRLVHKSSTVRLAAAELLIVMYKHNKADQPKLFLTNEVAPILAVLLELIAQSDSTISASATLLFGSASFLDQNKEVQEIASSMEAVQVLSTAYRSTTRIFDMPRTGSFYVSAGRAAELALQQQALLLAFSTLCTDLEDVRRRICSSDIMAEIVRGLSSPFPGVRCSAAQCTRSLSRSINILKTALLDTHAGPSLHALLSKNESTLTHLAAMGVLGNAFMEFSPLKTDLIEMKGLVERVVELAKPSPSLESDGRGKPVIRSEKRRQAARALLRHHALVAIKNLTFWSSSALKQKTVLSLSWEHIVSVLRDSDWILQVEMLNILRNVACNEPADVELVVRGIGEARLGSIVEEVLRSPRQELVLQGLYLVCNIATGTEGHRAALMNRMGLLRGILQHMANPSPEARVAAVWCVANLCPRGELGHRRHNENAHRLRSLGFEVRLKELRDDPSIDVRERVRDALEACFEPDTGPQGMLVD